MYAVISDRGRQFGVRVGDVIRCDHRPNSESGQAVTFDSVTLVSNEGEVRVGKPTLDGAAVTGEVVGDVKGEKLVVFKYRRRKNSRTKNGHRQSYTAVRITDISV